MLDISKILDNLIEKHFSKDVKYNTINENYFVLDFMKALAIFFVIIYHTGSLQNNILAEATVSSYTSYFFSTLIGTSVPMFFFTSGFLLLNKKVELNNVWSKMVKIFFLIIFWRFITFPIINLITGTNFTLKSIVIDTFSFKSGYTNHLWYLMALIFLYSIYPILKYIFDEKIKLFLFWLITITIFVFGTKLLIQLYNITDIIFTSIDLQRIPFANFISDFNFYSSSRGFSIVYFMIGGIIYKFPYLFKKISMLNYLFLSLFFISLQFIYNVLYSFHFDTLYDPVWWTYENLFTIPLVICLYFLIINLGIKNKQVISVISLIGKNSLGIYLTHNIVFQSTLNLRYLLLEINQNFGIIYSLIVLVISLLISMLLSNIPIIKEVFQISHTFRKVY